MTDELHTIDDAPDVENTEVAENDSPESQPDTIEEQHDEDGHGNVDDVFPKKAVNALNRKNKQIHKLRAQMRELEAKLSEAPKEVEQKSVNPDDFESYGDYINAQVDAMVNQKITQSQSEAQKQQLVQQQEALKAQRDMQIIEQANEAAQVLPDLPQLWQQNAHTLDALPEPIAEIFYSLDNAPAAIYALAKEGKVESLLYANPYVAAHEIVNAQTRGLAMMQKPQTKASQAPAPISKAKGTGSTKKPLSPNDDVLKGLGLKR